MMRSAIGRWLTDVLLVLALALRLLVGFEIALENASLAGLRRDLVALGRNFRARGEAGAADGASKALALLRRAASLPIGLREAREITDILNEGDDDADIWVKSLFRAKVALGPLAAAAELMPDFGETTRQLVSGVETKVAGWEEETPVSAKLTWAYFTPPHLVDHLVSRLKKFGMNPAEDRIRDSAAGGAAFLVPLARIKAAAWTAEGMSKAEIMMQLRSQLVRREIDKELAAVANALLRRMLVREFDIPDRPVMRMTLVKHGDSLDPKSAMNDQIDHEIGNPPFLRLRADDNRAGRDIFSEISSGRLNLYAMFVRRALEEVPSGGLVGYVIPASFLGRPECTGRRASS